MEDLSREISQAVSSTAATVKQAMRRDLSRSLYQCHTPLRQDIIIKKTAAYVILGINLEGRKEVLSIEIGQNESAKYWLSAQTDHWISLLGCPRKYPHPSIPI